MTTRSMVIGLTVLLFFGFMFMAFKNTQAKKNAKSADNPYEGLRSMAFATTLEGLGVKASKSGLNIHGVILDWDVGDGIVTLVAYQTGDASIYLSSGGGVIGGFSHENVNALAKSWVADAYFHIKQTMAVQTVNLPDADCVRFSFLTNSGVFSSQERFSNLESQKSEWFAYFDKANELITAIRLISDKR